MQIWKVWRFPLENIHPRDQSLLRREHRLSEKEAAQTDGAFQKLRMGVNYIWCSDEIKKLELYIPLISFTTLILFSTIVEGISSDK